MRWLLPIVLELFLSAGNAAAQPWEFPYELPRECVGKKIYMQLFEAIYANYQFQGVRFCHGMTVEKRGGGVRIGYPDGSFRDLDGASLSFESPEMSASCVVLQAHTVMTKVCGSATEFYGYNEQLDVWPNSDVLYYPKGSRSQALKNFVPAWVEETGHWLLSNTNSYSFAISPPLSWREVYTGKRPRVLPVDHLPGVDSKKTVEKILSDWKNSPEFKQSEEKN